MFPKGPGFFGAIDLPKRFLGVGSEQHRFFRITNYGKFYAKLKNKFSVVTTVFKFVNVSQWRDKIMFMI